MSTSSKGFSLIEGLLVVAVITVVGVLGYRVWDANYNTGDSATQQVATSGDTTPQIESAKDLDAATVALDQVDIEGNAVSQLDSELTY